MREHLPRVHHQNAQQVVFGGRQLHLASGDCDLAPHVMRQI